MVRRSSQRRACSTWGEAVEATPVGILHGLYWLVANLADEEPVLLAVDDAHWADEPSLRFLAYLARRVESLPIALVIGARGDHDPAGSSAERGAAPERVALQLLRASPAGDAQVVSDLRLAAEHARARGAPAIAVVVLQRALAEPPDPALRGELLL